MLTREKCEVCGKPATYKCAIRYDVGSLWESYRCDKHNELKEGYFTFKTSIDDFLKTEDKIYDK